jgi:hypothetical protein
MGVQELRQDASPEDNRERRSGTVTFRADDFVSVATALYPTYPHEWIALEVRKRGKDAARFTGRVIAHDPLCQRVLTKVDALYRHADGESEVVVRYVSTDLAEGVAR